MLKVKVRFFDCVRDHLISLGQSGYDYVYKNFYVIVEDVHTNQSIAWVIENEMPVGNSRRLVSNFSQHPSLVLYHWLGRFTELKAESAFPVNSTAPFTYVYRGSEGFLNDTLIISGLKEGLKKSLDMKLRSLFTKNFMTVLL